MEDLKREDYYSYERREMLEFVPAGAARVLDVGCGTGAFGVALKETRNAEVWGVEVNETAARSAAGKLDRALAGDVGKIADLIPDAYFDCIVFNDVLEHLIDPCSVLTAMKGKLCEGGVMVCSLPNIRYYRQLRELLFHKQWEYRDAGILDRTHLRFFTERSIKDMFRNLGFEMLLFKGMNPARSRNLKLLNACLFGALSDTRYVNFACVVRPSVASAPHRQHGEQES